MKGRGNSHYFKTKKRDPYSYISGGDGVRVGRYRIEEKESCDLVGLTQKTTEARKKTFIKPICMMI